MALKRNFKLYIQQKSTIWAIIFCCIFSIMAAITFIPNFNTHKGIYDEFKQYPITLLSTNNYNVTYAASDNELFYSQNKNHTSTLNHFSGIKDYSNAYGTYETKLYNFIHIPYHFPCKIIQIEGISDNGLGEGGETFILCEDGSLYMISDRSQNVKKIEKNIKQISVKRDYKNKKNIYLMYNQNNELSLYYFNNNDLYKTKIIQDNLKQFYYISQNDSGIYRVIIQDEKEVKEMMIDLSTCQYVLSPVEYDYPIYENSNEMNVKINDVSFKADKIVQNEDKLYVLYQGKVSLIQESNQQYSITNIKSDVLMDDIYVCGRDACIGVFKKNRYYTGQLHKKDFTNSENEFKKLDSQNGLIYGNDNSTILYKNQHLYIYDAKMQKFISMYPNYWITYGLRALMLFAILMMIFYFIMSFLESNKRYNRYFQKRDLNQQNNLF